MIGIIGISGKIGRFLASELNDNYEIVGFDKIISTEFLTYSDEESFFQNKLEIVVDFSNSELSKTMLLECINRKIKVISGTSNIQNLNEIKKLALDNKVSFVYLENFSKGINQLVDFLENIKCDKKELIEEHYYTKKDISQTAITIANLLNIDNVSSIRSFKKQSNHYIKFYLENEEIEIIHRCLNPLAYKEVFLEEFNKIKNDDFYFKCGII